MKPFRRYLRFIAGLSFLRRPRLAGIRAMAITLPLLVVPISAGAGNAAASASTAHVYLLRGFLNVFSLGLDDIAANLQQQGISVTLANHFSWASIAEEAAADYKSGRAKTIILVGHSWGANVLPNIVAYLDQLDVPVALAIGLDPFVSSSSLEGRVGRYINFYVANGAGARVENTKQFRGTLENVDVGNLVGHLTIDKSEIMQRKVISAIDAVALHPHKPSPIAQQAEARATTRPASGAADGVATAPR